jgi:hypothetical protein
VAKIGASTIVADMESILNLRDHNSFLAPAGVHKIIMNLPQCQSVTPTQAAEVVNICVAASRFSRGKQAQEYFRTRCRWCVLEFFGEAKNVLENIERQDPNMLARQGKAVIGAHAEQAKKANEVCFRGGNSGGGQARRELSSGDSVRVSRYPPRRATPAAGVSGVSGVSGAATPTVPVAPEECYEGEVTLEKPLIVKFVNQSASKDLLSSSSSSSSSSFSSFATTATGPVTWRIDKMANKVSYSRQMAALTVLTSNAQDDSISYGNKSGQGSKGRPNNNIIRAVVESFGAPDIHNIDGLSHSSLPSFPPPTLVTDASGDAILHGSALAHICAAPCEHPETGRTVQGTGARESYDGPTSGLNESQRHA